MTTQPIGSVITAPVGIDQDATDIPTSIASRAGQSQYDADGNLKSDAQWQYTWDAENRLIAMESGAGVSPANRKRLEFQYDTQSRRIVKRVYTWTADRRPGLWSLTSDLRFVYDGWNMVAELTSDSTSIGAVKGNAYAVLRSYLWGMDLSGSLQGAGGVGGLLAVVNHANRATDTFVSYDGNGNVVSLVDAASGTVSDRYEYDPFGNEITPAKGHSLASPFRFSTKYTDDETGLVYYGYRYYCPYSGKWLSRDPIAERGGNNLYGFLNNGPIAQIDKLGKIPQQPCTLNGSPLTLVFNGLTVSGGGLSLRAASGVPITKDVGDWSNWSPNGAGMGGDVIEFTFDYTVANQRRENSGPIPAGLYRINAAEERSSLKDPIIHIFGRSSWGLYSWLLNPDPSNTMYNRGRFYLHGSSYWGCLGCIDLKTGDTDVHNLFKTARTQTGGCECYVTFQVLYTVTQNEFNDNVIKWAVPGTVPN